jgi:NarL family two-component system response regulator YdfI
MIRVFIIAPIPMIRAGLHAMLTTANLEVVGEASEAPAPNDILEGFSAIDVIVVADEKLLEDIGRIVTGSRSLALVVLSDSDERLTSTLRRLSLRGWSIAPLDAPATQLQAAIVAAAEGFIALPSMVAERALGERSFVRAIDIESLDESLTGREREVLEMLSRGLSNKLIARRLSISEHTVKFHVSSIYTKLGASSRTDAVSRGVRRGLITL